MKWSRRKASLLSGVGDRVSRATSSALQRNDIMGLLDQDPRRPPEPRPDAHPWARTRRPWRSRRWVGRHGADRDVAAPGGASACWPIAPAPAREGAAACPAAWTRCVGPAWRWTRRVWRPARAVHAAGLRPAGQSWVSSWARRGDRPGARRRCLGRDRISQIGLAGRRQRGRGARRPGSPAARPRRPLHAGRRAPDDEQFQSRIDAFGQRLQG